MAISIDHNTFVISIPQADLTFVSSGLYELDVLTLKNWLADYLDNEQGMNLADIFRHNTTVTLGALTLARVLEILAPYTITFTPNSAWAVRMSGGNNNLADVINVNSVSLRTNNSAGMVTSGSGVTAQDKLDIADRVWDEPASEHATTGSFAMPLKNLPSALQKNVAFNNFVFVMYSSTDHVTPIAERSVTATRSLDGGAFASAANSIVEISNGAYKINLAATDLNANSIMLRFTATGADDVLITLVTRP